MEAAADQSFTESLSDMITIDATGDSDVESPRADMDTTNKPAGSDAGFITLDSTGDASVITLDTTAETGTTASDSTADPSVITLDTTAETGTNGLDSTGDADVITLDTTGVTGTSALDSTGDADLVTLDTTPDSPDTEMIMPEGISFDIEGNEEEDLQVGPTSRLDIVPSYEANVEGILTDVEFNMETGKKVNEADPKRTCFNCLGDHNVSDCPDPLDQKKIIVNRRKYNVTRVPNVRYHEDGENKYGNCQPGKISDKLQYALGLRKHQVPLFVYRMRVLGYPPGWLRNAEVSQGDMKMYDANGHSVNHPDVEDGETDAIMVRYKPEKLVSFPGFNDSLPQGKVEEAHYYDCPPMQHHHQRTEFLKYMNMNKVSSYKKKKLKAKNMKNMEMSASSSDMEVDEPGLNKSADIEFNPPLPTEPLPPPPPEDTPELPKTMDKDVEEGELSEDEDSQASLGDLEEKRRKILSELGDESSSASSLTKEDTFKAKNKSTKRASEGPEELSENTMDNLSESDTTSESLEHQDKKMKKHHRSHSKGFKLGAAIPESITPYTKLPPADLWTVDVSDVINFENLPDALGTWDKMKGLMSQVRNKVKELHADSDDETG